MDTYTGLGIKTSFRRRLNVECTAISDIQPHPLNSTIIHKNHAFWAEEQTRQWPNAPTTVVSYERFLKPRESTYKKIQSEKSVNHLSPPRVYQTRGFTKIPWRVTPLCVSLAFNPCRQKSISERDLKIVESDNTAGCQVFFFFSNEQLISKCAQWLITTLGLIGIKCSRMAIILMQIWICCGLNPVT